MSLLTQFYNDSCSGLGPNVFPGVQSQGNSIIAWEPSTVGGTPGMRDTSNLPDRWLNWAFGETGGYWCQSVSTNGAIATGNNFISLTITGYNNVLCSNLAFEQIQESISTFALSLNGVKSLYGFNVIGSTTVGDSFPTQTLTTISGIYATRGLAVYAGALTTVEYVSVLSGNISINDARLTAASVNGILNNLVTCGWQSGNVLSLTGGTSAGASSLTAQGQADRATLQARGCTINLNP